MVARLLRALRRDAPALLLALGLAIAVTWPLATAFFTRVPGNLIADRDQNLWNLWWVKIALQHFNNPFHTPLLYYPDGVDLYAHTLALPNGLIGLLPQLLFGLPAAYNTVVLFALALAVYGGFRFVRYWLVRAATPADWRLYAAALAGGIAFGLNAYGLDALKGQTEVLSYGWLPLYTEAWLRAWDTRSRKAALLAGLLFGVTMLTNLYYAFYLALFTLGFLAFVALRTLITRNRAISSPAGARGTTLAFAALGLLPFVPYMAGLAASVFGGGFELSGAEQQGLHSADLLSYFSLRRDPLWLGLVGPLLAVIGLVAWRRRAAAWALALGALGALVLALGAVLTIGGVGYAAVPLPWALLENLPVFGFVGKVERFAVLARLLLAPLVGVGLLAVGQWVAARWRYTVVALVIGALLLVDVPLRAQPMAQLDVPAGFAALGGGAGALFELPLAAGQVQTMGERMLYQTTHGIPIIGGYLARSPSDPLPQCAPVWGLITWQPGIADRDVITPHVMAQPLALLQDLGIGYYAVYNYYDPLLRNPVAANELAAFNALAAATSDQQPVFSDDTVTIYRVRAAQGAAAAPALQLGAGWGGLEKSGAAPFRWLQGAQAGLCVQNALGKKARLTMNATSFARDRTLEITMNGAVLLRQTIPAGGAFVALSIPPFTLPGNSLTLSLRAVEGSASPSELGLGSDTRSLSIGFSAIKLEIEP